ncbi:MAG TPA: DUF721 domain-containing protein [Bryobacteraceae bacterium]|nr:DUF721 domain-containing protein [Bryobacteraceae bacterium]
MVQKVVTGVPKPAFCGREPLAAGVKIEFVHMERIAKSLARLKLSDSITTEELARAAWVAAVGKRIAAKATAKALVRNSLVIEVEDTVWRANLFQLRFQILGKLAEVLGSGIVQDLEFRVPTTRRPPQPALSLNEKPSSDEADGIPDRGMRILYKQARKKASA